MKRANAAAPAAPAAATSAGLLGPLRRVLVPLALLLVAPGAQAGVAHAQDAATPQVVGPKALPGPAGLRRAPVPRLNPVTGEPLSPAEDAAAEGDAASTEDGTRSADFRGSGSDRDEEDAPTARTVQDEDEDEDEDAGSDEDDGGRSGKPKPPILGGARTQVTIDFVDTPITDLIKYFAEITGRNFLLTDDLKGEVTIISHKPVSVGEAYEAFLSALESAGYTTVTVGGLTKVVATGDAGNSPLREYYDGNIPYTDNYVTQIIQLENVAVGDVSSVVKELAGKSAKVIAYSPTNTLIITDSAVNIRRVYRIINQLDVAAPRARLEIIPIQHATASEIQQIIEEVYGGSGSEESATDSRARSARERLERRRNRRARNNDTPAADTASSTTVGKEGSFIEKIITDERTNSIIVLANDAAIDKIKELIAELDIDVDPSSRAAIHVIYLEHAKAEDVSNVLSNLAEASGSSRNNQANARNNRRLPRPGDPGGPDGPEDGPGNVVAALDEGVRITSDENTNSLVIVATPDQFRIIKAVIDKLDIRRKQVFVQAVILEMASDDTTELGFGLHGGVAGDNGQSSLGALSLGTSSLALSTESLSGLALGVYGQPVEVSLPSLTGEGTSTLSIPAFGIALNALASNSAVNIVATPEILTMANEEAKIVVGRNVPFPVSTGRDNNNNPIISYQREDVATTLKVTPQINESNFVTLELFQEVTEVEEDDSGLDVTTAGFITSKRSAETTVLVKDNQTVVIGGLIGSTDTEVETKLPVLGDLPLIGNLFRGKRNSSRKTNLLIFLTPHIIDEPADLEEVYRIKWAQREEFIRRFYGKSKAEQQEELSKLLRYSMNRMDEPSPWRTKPPKNEDDIVIGGDSDEGVILDDGGTVVGPGALDGPGPDRPGRTPDADIRYAPGEDPAEDAEVVLVPADSTDSTDSTDTAEGSESTESSDTTDGED